MGLLGPLKLSLPISAPALEMPRFSAEDTRSSERNPRRSHRTGPSRHHHSSSLREASSKSTTKAASTSPTSPNASLLGTWSTSEATTVPGIMSTVSTMVGVCLVFYLSLQSVLLRLYASSGGFFFPSTKLQAKVTQPTSTSAILPPTTDLKSTRRMFPSYDCASEFLPHSLVRAIVYPPPSIRRWLLL
jgi:hypothetical protein